ncbi:bifunctional phosphopantothenoylcysteine decarboxylase/phosphopantothenate--cysteine ligase CoaBC [Polynucleobacter asymbioticus]|jgi:phosphopantothenoylcysteine decarboxylase/phosphopantothenate--cysteine ligase|uniref:Coenzyme A biosynthesis bifunctional protein CoaBC n=2 Tax=Polynucleobacter asymbioticus TaxID=576611 RepID=A4SZP1_POLAQ|nr:bifunctional phosphopantothenoylcysteine decarboxylase/phosphopantothenate--cysteine ligase CoaBC [Polynucleobacter asymbioticus]ABP34955.1 Phosphopantothenoylcysteine decarboxylase / Phosphopantothenate-cysteine ligase [Polynucleobacter asymbioticus QLW-P1DMWA-1]APB99589.1 phosphopantothenate synthase [Polynucleobacter asymbioticus]APC01895.1 phosphopantothenate synthase [Polynucleobacter asymbioticus]APC06736.1 phosphopantothenate synthase [Polynucleobacter asymbioticus]
MQSLLNKKIVLGISGGIAAYKAPELARQLMQEGATVQVVMTEAAQQFVTPVTMQALTGNPVYLSQWDSTVPNNMAHIELSRSADAILVAPASADLIAKLSLGLADDLLSTLCLARDCPLLVTPAMNKQMWEHAATQRSVQRLSEDGVTLLGPASGFQACGETGMGRMLEPSEITEQLIAFFQKKSLAGKKVLITAGPTFEAIDPVRGITNHSSGKMGFAIARAAVEAGAHVHLIAGPCDLDTPLQATGQITRTNVISAKEMHAATLSLTDYDLFFAVAAVADWGIAKPSKEKIKRQGKEAPNLEFIANPDILFDVAKSVKTKAGKPHPYCIGFAAESTNLEKHADEKRKRKGIPMIVGNIGPETFGSDLNQLLVIDANGSKKIAKAEKLQLARQLIQLVAKKI